MSKLTVFFCTFALSTSAFSSQIFCKIKLNSELVYKTQFEETQKKVILGKYNDYQISITKKGPSTFEIEAYNREIPSRTYALGTLDSSADQVSLDLWTRKVLLQSSCEKLNE